MCAFHVQVVLLSEQKLALEQRINTVCLEDEALQGSLSSLRAQITRLESRSLEQALQVTQCVICSIKVSLTNPASSHC